MQRCLIVVDYQYDFVVGSLGFPEAEALDELIAEKIRVYRSKGDAVVFTLDTYGADYFKTQEGKNLAIQHCIKGTPGHQLYGKTAEMRRESDRCFYKSSFGSSGLYEYLQVTAFERIEIVGVSTHVAVIANAILAKTAQPETPIVVAADCTASQNRRLNQAALDTMIGLQIRIARKITDTGPFYHGTKADLAIGELLTPGYHSNYGKENKANYIYFTSRLDIVPLAAELALGAGRGRIYIVEPTGDIEDDPNLTDKKFHGNVTKSYRSREPLRIVGEVSDWVGLTPEELQMWRQKMASAKKQGIEAIND